MAGSAKGGKHWAWAIAALLVCALFSHALRADTAGPRYRWSEVTAHAAYPTGYNYPVVVANGRMWAVHAQGTWSSGDGRTWRKEALPPARRNVYESQIVMLDGAMIALGMNSGNYLAMQYRPTIRRTTDFRRWEILSTRSNLPPRIFYGLAAFKDKLWLAGGFDGGGYHNDVWNSTDGRVWQRVVAHAGWSPRSQPSLIVYRDQLWLIGGGAIDGDAKTNPRAEHEIWSSADGATWKKVGDGLPNHSGGTPVVFDGALWLVGANRDGRFGRSSLVTTDGVSWREEAAPWTPRGGVAAWVYDGKLWMTGGKYSVTENGEIRFIDSNDVWAMQRVDR
jgi:hypothetical protein